MNWKRKVKLYKWQRDILFNAFSDMDPNEEYYGFGIEPGSLEDIVCEMVRVESDLEKDQVIKDEENEGILREEEKKTWEEKKKVWEEQKKRNKEREDNMQREWEVEMGRAEL